MQRAQSEINNAVLKFERNLNTCAPYCCFGNDNKIKIIAMIDVIKNNRSKIWINSTYLTPTEMMHEHPDNPFWQAATDARDWLDGDFTVEELLFTDVNLIKNSFLKGILFPK